MAGIKGRGPSLLPGCSQPSWSAFPPSASSSPRATPTYLGVGGDNTLLPLVGNLPELVGLLFHTCFPFYSAYGRSTTNQIKPSNEKISDLAQETQWNSNKWCFALCLDLET